MKPHALLHIILLGIQELHSRVVLSCILEGGVKVPFVGLSALRRRGLLPRSQPLPLRP